MGFFNDLFNPIQHVKHLTSGVKAIKNGDIQRALDPSKRLVKESSNEQQQRLALQQALRDKQSAIPRTPDPTMGLRGPTTYLNGNPASSAPRQYTPNPFTAMPGGPGPSASSPAPAAPPVGMAPPQRVAMPSQPGGMGTALINALRNRK